MGTSFSFREFARIARKIRPQMKRNHIHILFILITGLSLLAACKPASQTTEQGNETISVTVSILPQAYFVERIAGDMVSVNVMVGPGEEAHTYEPKPEQMKSLSSSAVFFSIGVEYEDTWIPRFKDINPEMMIVDSAEGIQRIELSDSHSHDDEEDTEEETLTDHFGGTDPHVWLAPDNGKHIAENILNALITLLPEDTQFLTQNYNDLINEIDQLDEGIRKTLSNFENRTFMVFHPAWGYFAEQYGLTQVPVQVGGQDPSPAELVDLIKTAQDEKIKVIFIQPTFSAASVEALSKELDAQIVQVDPLARDWLENLKLVAGAFADALGQ